MGSEREGWLQNVRKISVREKKRKIFFFNFILFRHFHCSSYLY